MALLKTVGLCKYFGGLKAVNHVDMEVQQGQVFGIIGPNGAGKTTFFQPLRRDYPRHGGRDLV